MRVFYYFYSFQVWSSPDMPGEGNIWVDKPTPEGIIVYSIITPIISLFAILGNALSLMVFTRPELKGSVYVYLAVLAGADLATAVLIFLSGLFRGVLFMDYWPIMDAVIGIPLSGTLNCLSVITTMAVTLDRSLCLKQPLCCQRPKFCHPRIAKKVMLMAVFISIVFNLPYCFIFKWKGEKLITKAFFYSRYYFIHNWICFVIFGVIPSILLVFGNGYLIYILQDLKRITKKCQENLRNRKKKDYTNLTTALILVVFFFLITEIPSLLISRTSAVTFFFGNQEGGPCNSETLEMMREVITLLSALSLATDFFIYLCFCPSFSIVLRKICKNYRQRRSKRRFRIKKSIQMNVFVIDNKDGLGFDEKMRSIRKMTVEMIKDQEKDDEESFPSSLDDPYPYCCDIEKAAEDCQTKQENRKTASTSLIEPKV